MSAFKAFGFPPNKPWAFPHQPKSSADLSPEKSGQCPPIEFFIQISFPLKVASPKSRQRTNCRPAGGSKGDGGLQRMAQQAERPATWTVVVDPSWGLPQKRMGQMPASFGARATKKDQTRPHLSLCWRVFSDGAMPPPPPRIFPPPRWVLLAHAHRKRALEEASSSRRGPPGFPRRETSWKNFPQEDLLSS